MDVAEIISVITFVVLFGLRLPMEGDVSTILGYVLKCNYHLPYNRSENDFALSRTTTSEGKVHPRLNRAYMTRWTLYGMLERTMKRFGFDKACLLRVVCESAAYPFKGHGLLGELLHVLLTPSTTSEEYEIHWNREYHAAEAIGRNTRGRCAPFYPECEYNSLDYFTKLHV
ncbi:hypothetical protein ACFW04_008053 [Cataglyphis niger]